MHTGLRRKMIIATSAALLVLSGAVAGGFYFAATNFSGSEIAGSRLLVASSVARTIAQEAAPWFRSAAAGRTESYLKLTGYLTALLHGDSSLVRLSVVYLDPVDGEVRASAGTDVTSPGEIYTDNPEAIERLRTHISDFRAYADPAPVTGTHGNVQLAVAPFSAIGDRGRTSGAVVLEYRADTYRSMLLRTIWMSLVIATAVFALSLLFIVPFVRHLTGPIRTLHEAVGLVSSGDLSVRVRCRRGDEFGDLTDGFNAMVDRLEESFARQRTQEEQLRSVAYSDELTGLGNRKAFFERVEELLLRTRRATRGQIHALLFIDLDGFRAVNESRSHAAGDAVLYQTARRLENALRETDQVYRLNGDEFTVMLLDLRHETDASIVARKLLDALSELYELSTGSLRLTASIGISLFPRDALTAEALIREADTALAEAKRTGDTFRFFSQEMQDRALFKLQLVADLHDAVEEGQFALVYQPIVSEDGRITDAEALVRWHSPTRGLVNPADFIPLTEETGLIVPLGKWIIETACRQLRIFHLSGLPDLRMSVNLSPRQFVDSSLSDLIVEALVANDLSPEHLVVEITESLIMDHDGVLPQLARLRDMGVFVSIDDFGTGYSSLSRLSELPIDVLKVDRSFVAQMDTENPEASLLASIVALAHSLGLDVVVEGVETAEQADSLLSLRCDHIQGYIYSPPLAPEAFTVYADRFCERDYVLGA